MSDNAGGPRCSQGVSGWPSGIHTACCGLKAILNSDLEHTPAPFSFLILASSFLLQVCVSVLEPMSPTCNAGDLGSTSGLERSPGEGNGSSILAWRIPRNEEPGRLHTVGGVAKSQT